MQTAMLAPRRWASNKDNNNALQRRQICDASTSRKRVVVALVRARAVAVALATAVVVTAARLVVVAATVAVRVAANTANVIAKPEGESDSLR